MLITSSQNPRIKHLLDLRDKRTRNETQTFLIEGYREILRAVEGKWPIEELYISPECFLGSNERGLISQIPVPTFELSRPLFEKISYRDRPDGLIAIAQMQKRPLPEKLSPAPFFVIAEAIEKPGNLGSILRSTDAAGADGLILCDPCTDIYNPNVVRSSVGTLFSVPVFVEEGERTLEWLKKEGIQIVAATPSAQALYTEVDLRGPVALVVGTEQLGLSDAWLHQSDIQVRIPMRGHADSLNVAAATTLLLYEVVRQRCN